MKACALIYLPLDMYVKEQLSKEEDQNRAFKRLMWTKRERFSSSLLLYTAYFWDKGSLNCFSGFTPEGRIYNAEKFLAWPDISQKSIFHLGKVVLTSIATMIPAFTVYRDSTFKGGEF
jgi:hypothetical protein